MHPVDAVGIVLAACIVAQNCCAPTCSHVCRSRCRCAALGFWALRCLLCLSFAAISPSRLSRGGRGCHCGKSTNLFLHNPCFFCCQLLRTIGTHEIHPPSLLTPALFATRISGASFLSLQVWYDTFPVCLADLLCVSSGALLCGSSQREAFSAHC